MPALPIPRDSVLQQLGRITASETFSGAGRSTVLLKFLVEQALDGQSDRLKEYTLGAEALGKGESFDPRTDPIVRAEASRLRSRLERYYATEGQTDAVLIAVPKGSYVPQFKLRDVSNLGRSPEQVRTRLDRRKRFIWLGLGGVLAVAALVLAVWSSSRVTTTAESEPLQFEVELAPAGTSLGAHVGTDVILSPDGTRVAFVARAADGRLRLMTRGLQQSTVVEVSGSEGARSPFFSPDGRWIGFASRGKLKKVSVDGGSPVDLADTVDLAGASWGDAEHIIARLSFGTLSRVPSAPGETTVISDFTSERMDPLWPQVLPGGTHVLFTAVGPRGPNLANIEALSLADGTRNVLVRGGTFGRYLHNGYLAYVNQGALFAVPFDIQRMAIQGTAAAVLDGVSYSSTFGFAQLDISQTGTLVYRRSTARGQVVPAWLQPSGPAEPLPMEPGDYTFPRLSPDGQRVAFVVAAGGTARTSIYERGADRMTHLPPAQGTFSPLWGPDGRFLVLGSRAGMYWTKAGAPHGQTPLTQSATVQIPWSFSPDGTRLAYHELSPSSGFDLWTVPVRASVDGLVAGQPELFLRTLAFETCPSFSPDGRWVVYGSGEYEHGKWDVYVRPFPDTGGTPVRVSSDEGGRIARWLPDGRTLVYRTDDQRLMFATYTIRDGAFVAETPREWTPARLADTGVLSNFDLDVDGRRILGLIPAGGSEDQQSRNHVTFMLNFSEEVRRRVSRPVP